MEYWGLLKLRGVIGLIPESNTKALRMIDSLGWTKSGEIPDLCKMHYKKSREAGIFNYYQFLYNELEEEILQTKVHGNPHQAQKCAELLLEVQEALLHDRRIKELFFDSGKMLRFVLKHLAHLQANDTDLSRANALDEVASAALKKAQAGQAANPQPANDTKPPKIRFGYEMKEQASAG